MKTLVDIAQNWYMYINSFVQRVLNTLVYLFRTFLILINIYYSHFKKKKQQQKKNKNYCLEA